MLLWLLREQTEKHKAAWMLHCLRECVGSSGTGRRHMVPQAPWALTWKPTMHTRQGSLARPTQWFPAPKDGSLCICYAQNTNGVLRGKLCSCQPQSSVLPVQDRWLLLFSWSLQELTELQELLYMRGDCTLVRKWRLAPLSQGNGCQARHAASDFWILGELGPHQSKNSIMVIMHATPDSQAP